MHLLILSDHPDLQNLFLPICLAARRRNIDFSVYALNYGEHFTKRYDEHNIPVFKQFNDLVVQLIKRKDAFLLTGADMCMGAHQLGREAVALAKHSSCPSLSIQHGPTLTSDEDADILFSASGGACVASVNDAFIYRSLLVKEELLHITGFPKYDLYQPTPRDVEAPILIAGSIGQCISLAWWSREQTIKYHIEVLSCLSNAFPGHQLWLRQHPADERCLYLNIYNDILDRMPGLPLVEAPDASLHEVLNLSSYVFSFSPSVVLEAIPAGRPACYVGPQHHPTMRILNDLRILFYPFRAEHLRQDFTRIPQRADEMMERYFYKLDGKASDRILDVAIRIAHEH